jgi:DnaK suppressor protein
VADMKRTGRAATESEWTGEELAEIQRRLREDITRLREKLAVAHDELATQVRDIARESGDEAADLGSLTSDVGAETSLANNARNILMQSERALERISRLRYGVCESCESAIGKPRLQAFPRATLCLECQQNHTHR